MRADQLASYLAQLQQQQRYRSRLVVEGPQGVTVSIANKAHLNFCSNDYLGLAAHPDLITALQRGADQYGVGSGASHLINGHSSAHHALEEELAEFVQRPRALLFSTGYMANLGVMTALLEKGDHVFEDRLNHASLLDGGLLSQARLQRYAHNDAQALHGKLAASQAHTKLVASDGVFSMDGDIAAVSQLAQVCHQHAAWLMIDDAHGFGVLGKSGRGTLEAQQLTPDDVPILMGTLGKAIGTFGAFIAGSEELIETLIQRARSYIYTTAMPAAIAEATRVSLRLLTTEAWRREKLQQNIQRFRQLASSAGLPLMDSQTAIQPVMLGEVGRTVAASVQLRQRGILISAIRPPTVPEGTARLRITLSSLHESAHIDRLIDELQHVCKA